MSGTQTTTNNSAPPPQFLAAYQALLDRATNVANQPLEQYSGDVVAGLSEDQLAGMQGIRDNQGIQNEYLDAATGFYESGADPITTNAGDIASLFGGQAHANAANANQWGVKAAADGERAANSIATAHGNEAKGIAGSSGLKATNAADTAGTWANMHAGAGSGLAVTGATQGVGAANQAAATDVWGQLPGFDQGISQYMTPYTEQVVDAVQKRFDKTNAQNLQGVNSDAISKGAWGGDRAGVASAIREAELTEAQAPVIAQLYNQGFSQATQQYNTDKGLQAGLGQNRANLMASTALGGGNLLSNTGISAGQLGSSTALGAGQLGANTALGAGQLGANTALGAGNLGSSTALQGAQMHSGSIMQGAQLGINAANVGGQLGLQGAQQQVAVDQGNRANAFTAGQGIQSVGAQAQGAGLADNQALLGSGGIQQQQEQAQLNVPYQQFQQQQAYPYQSTQFLGQMSGIAGQNAGGTSTSTQPVDRFGQILGAGTTLAAGAMMMSDRREKEDITKIGETKDGQPIYRFRYKGDPTFQIGLMAQDVEKEHPEAVAETAGGIKMVDYKKATDGAVKRAAGGGIAGIPDLSVSYIPSIDVSGIRGNGPPEAPRVQEQKDPLEDSSELVAMMMKNEGIKKKTASKGETPSSFMSRDDVEAAGPGFDPMEGWQAPEFTYAAGGGIKGPRLGPAKKVTTTTKANLGRNYGSRAADDEGKSLLPSTTYRPPMAPWNGTSIPGSSAVVGSGGGYGGGYGDQFKRGGGISSGVSQKRMASSGHAEVLKMRASGGSSTAEILSGLSSDLPEELEEDAPAFGDIDDLEETMPDMSEEGEGRSTQGRKGISSYPIDDEPTDENDEIGTPGRYSGRYSASEQDLGDEKAENKEALKIALMAAGLGMMSGKSQSTLSNVGEGGLQGLKAYMGMKTQNQARRDRKARENDNASYRGATLDQKSRAFADQITLRKKAFADAGQRHTDSQTLAEERLELERKKFDHEVKEGNYEYVGVAKDGEGKEIGQYLNKKDGKIITGPVVTKQSSDPSIASDVLDAMADQYLAGDKSVFTNLGRGAQGGANVIALRERVQQRATARGMNGAEVAAKMADFSAQTAALRSLATRHARIGTNIVAADQAAKYMLDELAPKVFRTQYKPVNVVIDAWKANTGDVPTRELGSALNTFLNEYATAVGGNQGMTVAGREHAEELLKQADSTQQFAAVVQVLRREMKIAHEAPDTIRNEIMAKIIGHKGGIDELPVPNAKQVEALKANPALATKFDDKFGKGAAATVLGAK